jgi:ferric-dicitrate binding protein FerR (iron transport regulator)
MQNAEARIVEVIGAAFIGSPEDPKAEKTAALKDVLKEGEYLRTGKGSLAELEFADSTSIRVASFSKFRYSAKVSNFILEQGEGIFSFPKGKGGFTVSTPAFAASIEGTTVYVKVTRNVVEYACLEGRCRIGPHTLTAGEKLVLRGSTPAYSTAKQPLKLSKVLKENQLATAFIKPLPNLSLIQEESAKQN